MITITAFVTSLPLPSSVTAASTRPHRAATSPISGSAATNTSEPLVQSSERASRLPWTETIAKDDCPLLFMPFLMHQLDEQANMSDLEDFPFEQSLSYQQSTKPVARIESWQWRTPHFRKIRATYIDAGWKAQVFNSVWYPSPEYDLPILGIDFLSFGKKKVLCVMDFQPLKQSPDYLAQYCDRMENVRSNYDGLSGRMSKRFYDDALFFSKQLIFAKFDTQHPVMEQLFPAFKEYISEYLQMIAQAQPDPRPQAVADVLELHRQYDQYSAERDPAVGLFSAYWGKEWAEKFTHEFLFSDAVPVAPHEQVPEEIARSADSS